MSYQVETPVFTGPFDLLLHLITCRQVEIYEIRLSEIVDSFVVEIERMEELDLEVATEFLLIASTLVELKSARLLPSEGDVDLDDETSLYERRDLLIARLLDAKTFKDASRVVHERLLNGQRYAPRIAGIEEAFLDLCPDLLAQVTPDRLAAVAARALTAKSEPVVDTSHIHQIKVAVGEVMHSVADLLESRRRATFRDLTVGCANRIEVAVHFLAILELFKQNFVDIEQFTTFGEITVIWAPVEQIQDWDGAGAEWDDEEPAIEVSDTEGGGQDRIAAAADKASDADRLAEGADRSDRPISATSDDALDDSAFAALVADELDIQLDDADLLDRSLLDNSDLIAEAADLLTRPARPDARSRDK